MLFFFLKRKMIFKNNRYVMAAFLGEKTNKITLNNAQNNFLAKKQ